MQGIKAFVINVATNSYRREHFFAQAGKLGMPVSVFDAVTPSAMDVDGLRYDEKRARQFTGRPMMETEKACALSHITLWRQLERDPDADFYLMLEDDIVIDGNMADIIADIDLNRVDLVKLSGKVDRPKRTVAALTTGQTLVRFAYGPLDTSAYLISKRRAGQLADYCAMLFAPLDIMMDRAYDHGVPIHGVLPYPVHADFCMDPESPLFTDIGVRYKFVDDITPFERLAVRFHRIAGSVKRKLAAVSLPRGS